MMVTFWASCSHRAASGSLAPCEAIVAQADARMKVRTSFFMNASAQKGGCRRLQNSDARGALQRKSANLAYSRRMADLFRGSEIVPSLLLRIRGTWVSW